MRITWKDGVTTLAMAGAIVVERAHFHSWDWPLISSMRWTIAIIAALFVVSFVFGYVLDNKHSTAWNWTAGILAAIAIVIAGLGLALVQSDYVVLLMLTTVALWAASIVAHLTVPRTSSHGATFA